MHTYKKLLLVYNPRSSHYAKVQEEVIAPVRQLSGWMVGKYEIKPTNFDDNVKNLSQLIVDDMLVMSAGGDGTATMVVNAIMTSGKDVVFAALGYGNFNDVANMLRVKVSDISENAIGEIVRLYEAQQSQLLYPISITVNGKHWRYAPAYFSVGLLAEATKVMEEPKVRANLDRGHKGPLFSLRMAVKWYLKNHKRVFISSGAINGQEMDKKTTDYLAVNSPTLARMMRGGEWWHSAEKFGSTVQNLGKFWKMVKFGLTSVRKGIPLVDAECDVISFDQPSNVEVHSEGEFVHLEDVQEIKVQKTGESLKVIGG